MGHVYSGPWKKYTTLACVSPALLHVSLSPVVTHSKCHRHPQFSGTCFLLVEFFCLCNLFIPSPNLLSNHASWDLFSSLSLTCVDANLLIHPYVSFLFSWMGPSSTRTGARPCVSRFPLYLHVLSYVYLLNPDENTKLKYPVLSLITMK